MVEKHIFLHPPMVWEPFFNREYGITDFNVVSKAYDIIREVGVCVGHHRQVANEYVDAPEPLYYDVVDVARQQYQNLFAEALRVFGTHIRECIPFGKEFFFMKDADVYDSTIKLVLCKDEQGHNRRCTIDELKAECLKVPNCAGFNSNGYLKSYIRKGETTGVGLCGE